MASAIQLLKKRSRVFDEHEDAKVFGKKSKSQKKFEFQAPVGDTVVFDSPQTTPQVQQNPENDQNSKNESNKTFNQNEGLSFSKNYSSIDQDSSDPLQSISNGSESDSFKRKSGDFGTHTVNLPTGEKSGRNEQNCVACTPNTEENTSQIDPSSPQSTRCDKNLPHQSKFAEIFEEIKKNYDCEYDFDIYQHLKEIEKKKQPSHNTIKSSKDIKERIRKIMIDWLIKVHYTFQLDPETLFLAVNILDRSTALLNPPRNEYQLLTIAALLISCKFEEVRAPGIDEVIQITNNAFRREEILKMEYLILSALKFEICFPSPFQFLSLLIKADPVDSLVELSSLFLLESTLMESSLYNYPPSLVALSCLYIARFTNNAPPFPETFLPYFPLSLESFQNCTRSILQHLNLLKTSSSIKGLIRKYSIPQFGNVAALDFQCNF